jgi:hypothetical protein
VKACTHACKLVNFNIDELLKVTMVILVVLHGRGKKRNKGMNTTVNEVG